MVFTSEHKRFIIESHFRNGIFNNGEWKYGLLQQKTGICNQNYFHASRASKRLDLEIHTSKTSEPSLI
jgi:hypothetical protein